MPVLVGSIEARAVSIVLVSENPYSGQEVDERQEARYLAMMMAAGGLPIAEDEVLLSKRQGIEWKKKKRKRRRKDCRMD